MRRESAFWEAGGTGRSDWSRATFSLATLTVIFAQFEVTTSASQEICLSTTAIRGLLGTGSIMVRQIMAYVVVHETICGGVTVVVVFPAIQSKANNDNND